MCLFGKARTNQISTIFLTIFHTQENGVSALFIYSRLGFDVEKLGNFFSISLNAILQKRKTGAYLTSLKMNSCPTFLTYGQEYKLAVSAKADNFPGRIEYIDLTTLYEELV